jgi:LCP family protein required for cell wall assembly
MYSERKRFNGWKIFGNVVFGTLCLSGLAIGTIAGWVGQSSVATEIWKQSVTNKPVQEVFENKGHLYFLVLGCDQDRSYINQAVTKKSARSDMMLLLRLDFDQKAITGVSIPRDMIWEVDGYRAGKINQYHEFGGKPLAEEAVEKLVGVDIDRVAVLDFEAFQRVVNLVGGIEIYVPKDMKYTDKAGGLYIDLKEGRQTLNGYNAMCFVRMRKSDSDYERQKRQKDLMLAFKDKLQSKPEMLTTIADETINMLGGEMNASEVAALTLFAAKVGQENIKLGMIPVIEAERNRRFGWHQVLDEQNLGKTLGEFKFKESYKAELPPRTAEFSDGTVRN